MNNASSKAKKVFFLTLGCRLNQAETLSLGQEARARGFEIAGTKKQGDIIVINSCSVTDKAQRQTEKILKKLSADYPQKELVITGCGAQKSHEKFAKVVPNDDKKNLFKILKNSPEKNDKEQKIYSEKTRLMFKVQDGCNNFCSYCIVPYLRGRESSLEPEKIISELKKAQKQGFKEIVLCGVNIGKYDYNGKKLSDLIGKILKETNFPRIRLSSINPDDFTPRLVALWAKNERLCPHFHISLQSGSNSVLERMGRKYNAHDYTVLVSKLKEKIRDVTITTDIIVGFPGETDAEFDETLEFVKKMDFLKVHVFRYSPREGTRAAKMLDQIPEKVKKERAVSLQKLEAKIRENLLKSYEGKEMEVLFEQKKNGYYSGFTANYIKVLKKSKKDLKNLLYKVKIDTTS